MSEFAVINSKTTTLLVIEPPVILVDKFVTMGETDIRAQYSVAQAKVVTLHDDEPGDEWVELLGYRLTKRGKVRENANLISISTCYVTTRHPDTGDLNFDSSAYDALKEQAAKAVGR